MLNFAYIFKTIACFCKFFANVLQKLQNLRVGNWGLQGGLKIDHIIIILLVQLLQKFLNNRKRINGFLSKWKVLLDQFKVNDLKQWRRKRKIISLSIKSKMNITSHNARKAYIQFNTVWFLTIRVVSHVYRDILSSKILFRYLKLWVIYPLSHKMLLLLITFGVN